MVSAFFYNTITDITSGRCVTTAYTGSVWIDTESGSAVRIEQSAEDVQPGFPITLAENAVEYDWVTIDCPLLHRWLIP